MELVSIETQDPHIAGKPPGCGACSYHDIGGGYCPDSGDSAVAKAAFILEGPGADEVVFGFPLAGATGRVWDWKLLPLTGLGRDRVVIANTIRCRPPANKYPIGKLRTAAERVCRQYDTKLRSFNPTCYGVTFHPAALFRTPNRARLVKRALERVGELVRDGERPCLLCGEKALSVFLPHLRGGLKKWQGHWEYL